MLGNDRNRSLLGNSTSVSVDDGYGYGGYNAASDTNTGSTKFRATKHCNILWLVITILVFVLTLIIGYEIGKRLASGSEGDNNDNHTVPSSTITLLISIDGFRASYLTNYSDSIPTLMAMKNRGLSATRMQSSFPTTTCKFAHA